VAARGVQNRGQWQAGCEASSDITNSQPCIFGGTSDVIVGTQAASRDTSTLGCYGNSDAGTFDLWLVPL